MELMWVLMIWAQVSGGNMIVTQEFTTKERCENVRDVLNGKHRGYVIQAECYPK